MSLLNVVLRASPGVAAFCTCLSLATYAQLAPPIISAPLQLSLESWNRAVMLPNGNTFLLHLRDKQPIVTKIFDSTGIERAGADFVPKKLNVRALERSAFRGLFAQHSEVLLFLEQEYFYNNVLFRLRFDAGTGRFLGEDILAEGRTMRVLQRPDVAGYVVVVYNGPTKKGAARYGTSTITRYDGNGRAQSVIPYHFDEVSQSSNLSIVTGGTDYLLNAEIDRAAGVLVTAGGLCRPANQPSGDIRSVYVFNARLLASDTIPTCAAMKLPNWIGPDYTISTNYSSPTAVYQYLVSNCIVDVQMGLIRTSNRRVEGLFLQLDGQSLLPVANRLFANWANIAAAPDSASRPTDTLQCVPLAIWTDAHGISTVLGEEYSWYYLREKGQTYPNTRLANLHLSQYNAEGTRLFDTVLPKRRSVAAYLEPAIITSRACNRNLFRGVAAQQAENQLVSATWWKTGAAVYTIFNDAEDNFDRSADKKAFAVRNPRLTEPVLYRFSPSSRQLEKWKLFGDAQPDAARACVLESACFDAASRRLATLIVHTRRSGEQAMRMAWTTLP